MGMIVILTISIGVLGIIHIYMRKLYVVQEVQIHNNYFQ